jgi:hypothetical protein
MKFISIYTTSPANWSTPPTERDIAEMGALIGEMRQAGALLDTGGVMSGGSSVRVDLHADNVTVTDGPFTEAKEVVGGFAVLEVASKDEAVAWTRRFLECAGDGTVELHELSPFS